MVASDAAEYQWDVLDANVTAIPTRIPLSLPTSLFMPTGRRLARPADEPACRHG